MGFLQCAGCRPTVCAKCSRKLIYVSNELVAFLKEVLARGLLDPSRRAFFMGLIRHTPPLTLTNLHTVSDSSQMCNGPENIALLMWHGKKVGSLKGFMDVN